MNQPTQRHGHQADYVKGCRCAECSAANRESLRNWRKRMRGHPEAVRKHGTKSGYTDYGCRCDLCREANNTEARAYRARKKAATVDPGRPTL